MTKELLQKCYDELASLNGLVVKSENVDCKFDDLLNELSEEIVRESKTIDDYFKEWEMNINELHDKKKDIMDLKDTYAKLEEKLLAEAKEIKDRTGEDIIKAKYGGNSDKTRKKYTDEVLKEEKQQIKDLELRIEHLTRRNEFIREMMAMQRSLIDVGVV